MQQMVEDEPLVLVVEAEPTAESTVENEPQAESETQTDPEIEVNAEEQPTLSPRQHFDLEDLPSDNPIASEEEDIESLQSELQECMDQASDSVTSSVNERQSTYPMRSNRGYPKDLVENNLIISNKDYRDGIYRNHNPQQDVINGISID